MDQMRRQGDNEVASPSVDIHEANPELTGKQEVLLCNIFRATTAHK